MIWLVSVAILTTLVYPLLYMQLLITLNSGVAALLTVRKRVGGHAPRVGGAEAGANREDRPHACLAPDTARLVAPSNG